MEPFSLVMATTYSVFVAGSITGVPVMPSSGEIMEQPEMSATPTVVTPGGSDETVMPERRGVPSGTGIRVECVDAIVLGGHENNIVDALTRNTHQGHVERLSIDLPVHRAREDLAEPGRIHVGKSQDGFLQVLPGTGEVIVIGGHAHLGSDGN